jgi:hypothetical protein
MPVRALGWKWLDWFASGCTFVWVNQSQRRQSFRRAQGTKALSTTQDKSKKLCSSSSLSPSIYQNSPEIPYSFLSLFPVTTRPINFPTNRRTLIFWPGWVNARKITLKLGLQFYENKYLMFSSSFNFKWSGWICFMFSSFFLHILGAANSLCCNNNFFLRIKAQEVDPQSLSHKWASNSRQDFFEIFLRHWNAWSKF